MGGGNVMENRREEIIGLKRLLVGVLVSALLITMLPFESMGSFVAKADDVVTETTITSLSEVDIFANAYGTEVTSADELNAILNEANEGTDTYTGGVIITLKNNIDFKEEGLTLPNVPVGIEMGEYSIQNINYVENTEGSILYVLGNGSNFFHFNGGEKIIENEDGSTTTMVWPVDLWMGEGQSMVFYDVELQNVSIVASQGATFGVNNYYYEVPMAAENGSTNWTLYYNSQEGIYRNKLEYIEQGDLASTDSILYVDELYFEEGNTEVYNVQAFEIRGGDMPIPNKFVYSQEAAEAIPVSKVKYDNNAFVGEYTKPNGAFMVDSQYGMYTLSDDGKTMTIYAASSDASDDIYTSVSNYQNLDHNNPDTSDYYLKISGNYVATIEDENGATEVQCERVIYVEGSIPETCDIYAEDGSSQNKKLLNRLSMKPM